MFFDWSNYEHDIITGNERSVSKRRKKRIEQKGRKRDWASEYQKRLVAGTANKVKS